MTCIHCHSDETRVVEQIGMNLEAQSRYNPPGVAYTLRPYQEAAVERSVKFLSNGTRKNGIIVLPTGAGKSLIIAGIAKELEKPVLIFQPRKEILEQNSEKLTNYGIKHSVYSASLNSKRIGNITLATIGSVHKKPEIFQQFPYVLVDECHYVNAKQGMYKKFLEVLPCKILGLTATPYRLASNSWGSVLRFLTRTRPKVFHSVVYHVQIADLLRMGYLADLKYYNIEAVKVEQLALNSTGADYRDDSVKKHYKEIGFADTLLNTVQRLVKAGRKHILVFTRFTDEATNLVRSLDAPAAIVTAKTPKRERERIIARFKTGEIQTIANVGILTIGFDFPALDTIVLGRPTRSLALYYQMVGRGIRPFPNKDGWVIDLCQTVDQFGKIKDLRMVAPRNNLWHIESKGRQLTNVYY